jgi:hypothetical protein
MQPSPHEQEILGNAVGTCLALAFFAAWIACIVFGCKNLKRAGYSPHLMWLTACTPIIGFAIFFVSVLLVRNARVREEAEKTAALRREEELRQRQAEELRRQAEERRQRIAAEHAANQRALALRLTSLVSDSTGKAASLPKLPGSADEAIHRAEREFGDGAFAPFWDAIEESATGLANFEATVQTLIKNSQFYRQEAPRLENAPPAFQIGLDTLPDASSTAERLRCVVRRAQKDFHFASIYEQRKTNQIFVAGFSTLGQALNELGHRLDRSLNDLASAIDVSISNLASDIESSQRSMTSELVREMEATREQAAAESQDRREHERQEREMLDNIQRRRKPFPPSVRDSEY